MHLTLFFTRGVSLRTWAMMGMLEREIAIYLKLVERGVGVAFVTYGDAGDLDYAATLCGIKILCNESGIPLEEYEQNLLSLHRETLQSSDVFKTNQTYGGELALSVATTFGKPLIARCGYMWSLNAAREYGTESTQARYARSVEEKVYRGAGRIVVTTDAMQEDVLRRMPDTRSKIRVIPNYVETDSFRPLHRDGAGPSLIFVGRIAPEKNLESLLEAIRPLDVRLSIIGEGKLRIELQRRFPELDARVTWEGTIPNSELPRLLNNAGIFVLPSLYEGHPKALLEAMACGLPVIGCNSPGVREVISHEETGYLAGTDPSAVRNAIQRVLNEPDHAAQVGANARKFVLENYSLDRILGMEMDLLNELHSS